MMWSKFLCIFLGVVFLTFSAFAEELYIPLDVTEIEDEAFANCTDITTVEIPFSVTRIGENAFSNCTGIAEVYFRGTQEQWDRIQIAGGNECLTSAPLYCNEYEELIVIVTADQEMYRSGDTLTFRAHIYGGTPPFSLNWTIEKSQVNDVISELDLYWDEHGYDGSSGTLTTNDRDVVFSYTVPATGSALYGTVFVTDVNGVSNGIDSTAGVASPYEWAAAYCGFVTYENYLSYSELDGTEYYEEGNEFFPISFSLYDMDKDGIQELLIHNGCNYLAGAKDYVYTLNQYDEIVYAGEVGIRECNLFFINDARYPGLFCHDGNTGYYVTNYYWLENGRIQSEEVLAHDYYGDGDEWLENPIIEQLTMDDALFNAVQNTDAQLINHYTPEQIASMGWWWAFLNTAVY